MDKIMGFYISPDLMFSMTFVSVMHFHNHLCISIPTKILKEIFAFIWETLILFTCADSSTNIKLYGVCTVDNRPSTNYPNLFLARKKKIIGTHDT